MGLEHPLGEGGNRLHEWALGLASWRETHGESGGRTGQDDEPMKQSTERSGAVIIGKNMFGPGRAGGATIPGRGGGAMTLPSIARVRPDPPRARAAAAQRDHLTFVTDGPESALGQARDAAGAKDVQISGDGNVAQQYLRAGLVEELLVHVAPVLLGSGVRLFDNLKGRIRSSSRSR